MHVFAEQLQRRDPSNPRIACLSALYALRWGQSEDCTANPQIGCAKLGSEVAQGNQQIVQIRTLGTTPYNVLGGAFTLDTNLMLMISIATRL